ncbi:hypothetical protein KKH3_35640 [Pectobacterium actinidiae]|nr:hypothetical protein KKH3_35640 [Pectobacterium actinidiae]
MTCRKGVCRAVTSVVSMKMKRVLLMKNEGVLLENEKSC